MNQLVHYDAMRRELDACHSVDEVKTFRNKALALETYARVANDHEAERKLAEIRIRAERQAGILLRDTEKAKPSGSNQYAKVEPSTDPRAPKPLSSHGISYDQSSQWQKLADVPEEVFEERMSDPLGVPSTAEIIRRADPPIASPNGKKTSVSAKALWLWGTLGDFEREGIVTMTSESIMAETMTPEMREDIMLLAPRIAAWLGEIHDN